MNFVTFTAFFLGITIFVSGSSSEEDLFLNPPPGTACSSDGLTCCPVSSSTVCPIFMSNNGFGCCNMPGASCCPKSSTTQGCCPAGTTCVLTGEYSATCVPVSGNNITATQVCTPGARYPPGKALPNVLYIGDSVSIGGEPVVANLSSSFAFVQHSPWAGGGGADDIGNGLNCQEAFLRLSDWELASWDYILFNFGLHDLTQTPENKAFYSSGLSNFTSILQLKQPQARLVYVTTTPFMPLRYYNNTIVEDLNEIADTIMNAQSIPIINTYDAVIKVCGQVYTNCSICDYEPSAWPANAPPGSFCGYHYTPDGWQIIGSVISDALKKIIG
jgi:hypothetical protein